MKRLRKRNVIAQARSQVPIVAVLRELGVDIDAAPEEGVNRRVYCPFGELNHEDGGRERQMRVYVDNSAWCFECNQRYDPVSLVAINESCRYSDAATRLLDRMGGASDPAVSVLPDVHAGLVAALGVWADAHGVDRTHPAYAVVLGTVDGVGTEDAVRWIEQAKRALSLPAVRS